MFKKAIIVEDLEPIIETIIQTLKTDPNAIETVWLSVIVFAGKPKTIVPLQELINFYPPKFPIGVRTPETMSASLLILIFFV